MDFLCREHSSVGLERLLDKQEVCGSNPHVPTSFEAFVRRFGQRLFFVARLGKRAACRNGPQQTPPPKIPLGPLPPAVPKIRLEPLPPAVPQPCPRAALRHAPHPKTPSRLHGKNVRFVGKSGSAAARRSSSPFPQSGARRIPTRTASQNAQPVARQERSVRRKERIAAARAATRSRCPLCRRAADPLPEHPRFAARRAFTHRRLPAKEKAPAFQQRLSGKTWSG